jgi:hypothetical protein
MKARWYTRSMTLLRLDPPAPRRLPFSFALLCGSGCAHFECTAHGGREVRALSTGHFVVTSDLPEAQHRAEADRLELLWDTFAAFFHADVPRAAIPLVVMSDASDVETFAPGYSGFVSRRDPDVLVVGAPPEKGQHRDVNAHELTHLVSAYLVPRQPRWVAEGLAALYEDATFSDARTVRMGRWNAARADEAFVVGVASLDELEAWGDLRFDDSERHLYASAWAWIHYLANHDEARLRRLFDGLKSATPLPEVMRAVFPAGEATGLQANIQADLGDARFRGWETSLRRTPAVHASRVLAPWEVHLLRQRLLLDDEAARTRELAVAVSLAPTPLPPPLQVARCGGDAPCLEVLLAAHPESPDVLIAARGAGLKLPADAVKAAIEHHEANAAWLAVAAETAAQENDYGRLDELANAGFALAPWSARLASLRMLAAVAHRRCDEAVARLSVAESLGQEGPTADFERTPRSTTRRC